MDKTYQDRFQNHPLIRIRLLTLLVHEWRHRPWRLSEVSKTVLRYRFGTAETVGKSGGIRKSLMKWRIR